MDIDKKKVGHRIKTIRLERGMTQDEFGKLFGATRGNVATWEKGVSLPNNERLKFIADMNTMSVNDLLYGKESVRQLQGFNGPSFQRDFSYPLNNSLFIPYQIKISHRTGQEVSDDLKGDFLLSITLLEGGYSWIFHFICTYGPSFADAEKISVMAEKFFPDGTDRNLNHNHYDKYINDLDPGLFVHTQKSVKEVIEGYFHEIKNISKEIVIWYSF